eukprot:10379048-Lingulodinium_polyedra.AAC.1
MPRHIMPCRAAPCRDRPCGVLRAGLRRAGHSVTRHGRVELRGRGPKMCELLWMSVYFAAT